MKGEDSRIEILNYNSKRPNFTDYTLDADNPLLLPKMKDALARQMKSNSSDLTMKLGSTPIPELHQTTVLMLRCTVAETDVGSTFGIGLARFEGGRMYSYLFFVNKGVQTNRRLIPTTKEVSEKEFDVTVVLDRESSPHHASLNWWFSEHPPFMETFSSLILLKGELYPFVVSGS